MMNQMLARAGLGFCFVASAAFASTAFGADALTVDPDGPGPQGQVTVDVFDWTVGNATSIGALPLPVGESNEFETFSHGRLGNFSSGGFPVIGTGLNQNYEYTYVAGFPETGLAVSEKVSVFGLGAGGPNFFEIYYDPSNDSDVLSGTGFDNGTLVLSGQVVDASGIFDVNNFSGTPVALDQFGTNNYSGQLTITGIGGASITVQVMSFDPAFFIDAVPGFLDVAFNTSQKLPYQETDPSVSYVVGSADAGHPTVIPAIGIVNGIDGTDVVFQSDPNMTFTLGRVCTGSIGDFVFHDENRNGIQDINEPGIDGATVILRDATGTQIGITTSGPNGFYEFKNLCAGDYSVEVDETTLPPDLQTPTSPNVGTDDTVDSDGPLNGGAVDVNLPTDDSNDPTIDFGYISPCTGRIGDFVFHDENRNGIQDANEPGIDGVTVLLRDVDGNQIGVTTSGPNGFYEFTSLCAGAYGVDVVEATLPPNLVTPTGTNVGGDDTIDSDGPADGSTVSVILPADNTDDPTIDFGYISPCTGSIGDFVFHDENRNGIQDANEPGIDDVTVNLLDAAGKVIATSISGPNGFYEFTGLCAGDYAVDVDETTLPPGLVTPTSPNVGADDTVDSDGPLDGSPIPVSLPTDNSNDPTNDFGYISPCTGSIGDFVFHDENRNGIQDPGEPGIDDATVILKDSTGTIIGTTTSGPNGFYEFTGLCADDYTVDVDETTLPLDLQTPTSPNVGADDAVDSDGPLDGGPVAVSLTTDNSNDPTNDFGYISPCTGSIGDFVFHDENRNGIQDVNEPGIDGATVVLKDSAGDVVGTTTSGPNGFYEFTGLCADDYTVDVDETTLPPDLQTPTSPNVGADDTVDSDGPLDGSPITVSLPTDNSNDPTNDFGYISPCTGSIGDFVFHDQNRNGVQDTGEPGIDGVTLVLKDSAGDVVETTTSGPNGFYEFTGLCADDYTVDVDETTLPIDLQEPTTPNVGGNDAVDSDGPLDGSPITVSLPTDNSNDPTNDFGYLSPCTGTIGDFVWEDLNGNGVQDAGEPGINDVTVELRDPTDNTLIATEITSGNGFYQFTGLCAGAYKVQVIPPAGFDPSPSDQGDDTADSDPSPIVVVLPDDNTDNPTIDFGFVPPCTGTIGDFVFHDVNRNGVQDAGEPGIDGVTVTLSDSTGVIATTTSGPNGFYEFMGLCAGDYSVDVDESTLPADLQTPTAPNVGGDDTVDSDGPADGGAVGVNLPTDNSDDPTIDFGYYTPCTGSIGDYVWNDANSNGIQDSGEAGIDGVTVILLDAAGNIIASDTTSGGGAYLFEGLCAGDYQVDVDESTVPAGLTPSLANQGANDGADSDSVGGAPVAVSLPADNSSDITIDFGFEPPVPACNLQVAKTCLVAAPPPADLLCQVAIASTTFRYTGPNLSNVTVEVEGDKAGFVRYENVDLVSGVTVLTSPAQSGFTIDSNGLGSKTYIRVYDSNGGLISSMEETIHTSCSAIYSANAPAPLDGNTPNPPNSTKGDPSPNWFVENFKDKDGTLVAAPGPGTPSSSCLIEAAGEKCTQRPTSVTVKYDSGACSDSINSQPSDKWSCAGSVSGTVHIEATNGSSVYFSGNVDEGGTFVLNASAAGRSDLDSSIDFVLTDSNGGEQIVNYHTSCSQPLFAGDVFGSLQVASYTNSEQGTVQLGANVTYSYLIENIGSNTVSNITVLDDILGTISGSPISSLAAGDSIELSATAFVDSTVTNTVSVNGQIAGQICPDGPATATATVTVVEPVAPVTPVSCSDIDPLTSLSMIWDGPSGVSVTTVAGEVFENVQNGNQISFMVDKATYGNDFDLLLSGSASGTSRFHLSCSDEAMNGSDDCGSAQGDGKGNGSNLVNAWLLDGMDGTNGSFNCGLPNSGVVGPVPGSGPPTGVAGAPSLDLGDDKKAKWELTNYGSQDVFIIRVEATWPSEHGELKKFKLAGDFAKDVFDDTSPTAVPLEKAFESDANKRKLKDGETLRLEIEFTQDFKAHQQSDYTITVEFDDGQVVVFP